MPLFIDGMLDSFSMDAGSPINSGTWDAVCSSANTALTGMDAICNRARAAFALCGPPGYHAGREYMGGHCYLNNAAIAAQHCIKRGARRVAILDIDFHHGNSTQDIFYDRSDALFLSIRGEPSVSYPYFSGYAGELGVRAGERFSLNLPLPKATAMNEFEAALDHAGAVVGRHAPDVLVISLGVDTFEHDPIGHHPPAHAGLSAYRARSMQVPK
ncbi:acetoin utilization deacetylase AcuC-like enzyme [Paraburkholderia sp. GAS448]|uniref:hypothetical protein n=1 Tax=Paraburkholderia sp. GAS448 TaxID=3035136 RepID=UPI003D259549